MDVATTKITSPIKKKNKNKWVKPSWIWVTHPFTHGTPTRMQAAKYHSLSGSKSVGRVNMIQYPDFQQPHALQEKVHQELRIGTKKKIGKMARTPLDFIRFP